MPQPPHRHPNADRAAALHRRYGVVDQEISEHRVVEGPADERCHHRVSQGRVPLSQTESAKDSGHYLAAEESRITLCPQAVEITLFPSAPR